jgi:hypothetical protein
MHCCSGVDSKETVPAKTVPVKKPAETLVDILGLGRVVS